MEPRTSRVTAPCSRTTGIESPQLGKCTRRGVRLRERMAATRAPTDDSGGCDGRAHQWPQRTDGRRREGLRSEQDACNRRANGSADGFAADSPTRHNGADLREHHQPSPEKTGHHGFGSPSRAYGGSHRCMPATVLDVKQARNCPPSPVVCPRSLSWRLKKFTSEDTFVLSLHLAAMRATFKRALHTTHKIYAGAGSRTGTCEGRWPTGF